MSDSGFDPALAPRMTILADHPILEPEHGTSDELHLESKLATAFDILRHASTETPMTIAIYGDWGTGKSSAMRWIKHQLGAWNESVGKSKKTDVARNHSIVESIWFDPWKYHTREDVWRGLIAEVILHCIDVANLTKDNVTQRLTQAAKQFGGFLGRSFLHALSRVKLEVQSLGAGAEISGEAFRDIISEYDRAAHPEKAYLNQFEDTLRQWVSDFFPQSTKKGQSTRRLAIFIDDLDRCLPEVTLEILEALKLYLNIPGLMFVVGLDRHVVDTVVTTHYKKHGLHEEKAHQYLNKMFQVEIDIAPSESQVRDFFDRQLTALNEATSEYWTSMLSMPIGEGAQPAIEIIQEKLLKLCEANPRETKRLLNSALLRGHAAAVDRSLHTESSIAASGGEQEQLRFCQGVQVYLLDQFIRRKHVGATGCLLRENVQDFFGEWARLLHDADVEYTTEQVREHVRAQRRSKPSERTQPVEEVGRTPAGRTETLHEWESLAERKLSYPVGNEQQPLQLWDDDDLWDLMVVPFSRSVAAATQITTSDDTDRKSPQLELQPDVANAVARELNVAVDEIRESDLKRATDLILSSTPLVDLSPLVRMTSLQSLSLDDTSVEDLAPLAQLHELQALDLARTPVSDISPLGMLPSLIDLTLSGTNVRDISALRKLSSLRTLLLDYTPVEDLTPLEELWQLELLLLYGTNIDDLGALSRIDSLLKLSVAGTEVRSLDALADLTNLMDLNISGTKIEDLRPLARLSELCTLVLDRTPVDDLSPLADLTNLKQLILQATPVQDLGALASLTPLNELDVAGTSVEDLTPIRDLVGLTKLNCIETPVADFQALSNLKRLKTLFAGHTQVTDLSPLDTLMELRDLVLSYTPIEDISHLSRLTNLAWLSLNGVPVSDLTALSEMTGLSTLGLSATAVEDLTPLKNLNRLRDLEIDGTPVSDLRPLYGLPELKFLRLTPENFTKDELTRFRNRVPRCSIVEPS